MPLVPGRRRRLARREIGRRRRLLRRVGVLAVVAGGLGTLRQRKVAENQQRFDLP